MKTNIYEKLTPSELLKARKAIYVGFNRVHIDYEINSDIPHIDIQNEYEYKTNNHTVNSNTLTIFVHGWKINKIQSRRQFSLIKDQIDRNNIDTDFIGVSWDSDISWIRAKRKIQTVSKIISEFIIGEEKNYEKINIIGHSLGTRIVVETIRNLKNKNIKIDNLVLLAAAINCNNLSRGTDYGNLIEKNVDNAYNFYSHNDAILSWVYEIREGYVALGHHGVCGDLPRNLTDVEYKAKDHMTYIEDISNWWCHIK